MIATGQGHIPISFAAGCQASMKALFMFSLTKTFLPMSSRHINVIVYVCFQALLSLVSSRILKLCTLLELYISFHLNPSKEKYPSIWTWVQSLTAHICIVSTIANVFYAHQFQKNKLRIYIPSKLRIYSRRRKI